MLCPDEMLRMTYNYNTYLFQPGVAGASGLFAPSPVEEDSEPEPGHVIMAHQDLEHVSQPQEQLNKFNVTHKHVVEVSTKL